MLSEDKALAALAALGGVEIALAPFLGVSQTESAAIGSLLVAVGAFLKAVWPAPKPA